MAEHRQTPWWGEPGGFPVTGRNGMLWGVVLCTGVETGEMSEQDQAKYLENRNATLFAEHSLLVYN